MEGGGIGLRILSTSELAEDVSLFKIGEQYLGGYQICLYDDELYSKSRDRTRLDKYVEQFKTALNSMSITGNRLNSHGFAFLWKDGWTGSLAPYSITVLNFAPFQSIERFLHLDEDELPDMVYKFIRLVREDSPEGHGNSLSEITDACTDLLENVCTPRVEAFANWGALRDIMKGRATHIAFSGWGLFGEALLEKLKAAYRAGNISYPSNSPDLGFAVIAEIVDDSYPFIDLSYADLSGMGFLDDFPEEFE